MKKHCSILLLLTVIFIATAASASSIPWIPCTNSVSLSSLLDNSLIFGDKKLSDIDFSGFAINGAITPTADAVFVQGGQNGTTGDYGLRFQFAWIAGPNQYVNTDLKFKISILSDPEYDNYFIKDVGMDISGASATGNGGIVVGETVRDAPFGNIIASLSCSKFANDGGAFLKDDAEFAPTKEIWIWSKDLSVTGGNIGSAHISEFFQFYSQTEVPEPATIGLLTLGGLTILGRKKYG
ncbi:MAG: PEP-CTERM sorting domain-containing protein [Phycisphaerae bacterium]|nr:PEP-CTERM sorting domain-containing protein [Phycisphaerae bacterium]